MDNQERYTLTGSCSVPQEINATVTRTYNKGNDHQVTFGIHIYDANHSEVKYYSDVMATALTSLTVSNQITLPAGEYSVEADAVYESGSSYSHEFEVNFYGTEERSFPFHTSFEEDGAQVSYNDPKTGEKCHVGSYVLDVPPSSSGYNQVVISYFGKTSATTHWTYVKETVNTGSSSSVRTIGDGYAYIDEVRMHPVDALMTTYTYKPLVGVTSQTDANGNVTYFEYNYGRLHEIKDSKGNIVTQYNYNYFKTTSGQQ